MTANRHEPGWPSKPDGTPPEVPSEAATPPHPVISTWALLGYFSVVLCVEWQVVQLALAYFGSRQPSVADQVVSWTITLALLAFGYWRGWSDFRRHWRVGGNLQLNSLQALLITGFVVAFGIILTWLIEQQ